MLCAHFAAEPTPSPSQEGSNPGWPVPLLAGVRGEFVGARFMGREQPPQGACCAHTGLANSVAEMAQRRRTILPLPRGEDLFRVAQIVNLPYRRLLIGGALVEIRRPGQGAVLQDGILRYSRLAVCATRTVAALDTHRGEGKGGKENVAHPTVPSLTADFGFISGCLFQPP